MIRQTENPKPVLSLLKDQLKLQKTLRKRQLILQYLYSTIKVDIVNNNFKLLQADPFNVQSYF